MPMRFTFRVPRPPRVHTERGDDDQPPSWREQRDDSDEDNVFRWIESDMELYRRVFSHNIATGPRARLRVENRNGLVNVRAHESPEVVVNVVAELYADSPSDADREVERIQRAITSDGEDVTIRTPELLRPSFLFFGRGPKVDYDISVPRETSVVIENRNGRVEVRGVRGTAQVENRNGRVEVEDVGGNAVIDVRNARISLIGCGGSAEVRTRNGATNVERVQGPVNIRSTNGALTIADCGASVEASGTNGAIRYQGEVKADMRFSTVNFGVRLLVPEDSRFEIDAETRNGKVESRLPVRGNTAGGGPRPKVHIRTVNGSIRIEPLR